jgi:hypothetical protein
MSLNWNMGSSLRPFHGIGSSGYGRSQICQRLITITASFGLLLCFLFVMLSFDSSKGIAVSPLKDWKTIGGTIADDNLPVSKSQLETIRARDHPRICKVSMVFGDNDLQVYNRALRKHEEHNRIHGYTMEVLRGQLLDDVWSKPSFLLSLILEELLKPEEERVEWLMWVDADTVLMNPLIPVDIFLPPQDMPDVHLIVNHDWNGLNNGIFFIRVNQWAAELFASILSFRFYRPDEDLTFRDQSAMSALLEDPKFSEPMAQVSQRWFNPYPTEETDVDKIEDNRAHPGDLLVHFAGIGERAKAMRRYLRIADQHLPEWEVSLANSTLRQETEGFWNWTKADRQQKEAERILKEAEEAAKQAEKEAAEQAAKEAAENVENGEENDDEAS